MTEKVTLVTGGTGFIGGHLVDHLESAGRRVRIMAQPKRIDEIEDLNLKRYQAQGQDVVVCDLREPTSLPPALENVDCVYHLAAISRPMDIDKQTYYDINVEGTRNLLDACRAVELRRLIHVSTVSVLGVSPDGHPLKEDDFQPETMDYGLSKREGERVALSYHAEHGLPVAVIRPPLMYGPGCVVRSLMFRAVNAGFFPLFGGGHAKMELCYVENLVQALTLAETSDRAVGEVFNITDGQSYEIREVIRTIQKHLEKKRLVTWMPLSLAIVMGVAMECLAKLFGFYPPFSRTAAAWLSRDMNVYDCTKAREVLGYAPAVSLDEGVRRTVAWFKEFGVL